MKGERAYATTRSDRGSVKRIHDIDRDVRWCWIEGGGLCADRVSTMDTLNTLMEKLPVEDGERLKQFIEKQQKTETLHLELIRQLNHAMALNKVVLNAAGDGIIAVDEDRTIIDFNPALADMFGYTERELKGQKLELILPNEALEEHLDGQRALDEWPLAPAPDKRNGKKIYGLHKKNGPFRVSVTISQGLSEDEKIFSGIIRDLTQQDRLEKENEKQAQKLFNRAKEFEGLYNLSKLLEEDSVPAIFEKLFKDIVPKTTTHPDTAVIIAELDGHTYRSGNETPVVSLSSDLHNGKLTFGFSEDIPYGTARHQKLLDMFTAELDHIILRKKARQRELKIEREAAVGELESGVAHNVNNGLQIIQGYTQVALGLAETEAVREPLDKIRSKTRELGAMIRGVQQTTDHKPGKANFEIIDLGELLCGYLTGAEDPLKSEALRQGTTVTINKKIGVDTYVRGNKGDITLLAQALIKNGVDSLQEDGSVNIDVNRKGKLVHLQVRDTGRGMSEELQQKLFDPSIEMNGTKLRKNLSLSTAQRIASEHGGEIKLLRSRVGHGTTIELRLPYAHYDTEKKSLERRKKEHLNILWAEDDIVIQETVKMMASSFDDHIDFVENGKMAMDRLQQKAYDVLVTDVGMPIMGGWKLLKSIEGRYDNMTRVLASGYIVNADDMNASGASYILNKPLEKNDLIQVLEDIKTNPQVPQQPGIAYSSYSH